MVSFFLFLSCWLRFYASAAPKAKLFHLTKQAGIHDVTTDVSSMSEC